MVPITLRMNPKKYRKHTSTQAHKQDARSPGFLDRVGKLALRSELHSFTGTR
jgi:hypothetical protein